jgi:uncharacterized protein YdaU (DUF1376 family)
MGESKTARQRRKRRREQGEKSPAFQFYVKEFMSDANVQAMQWDEIGMYVWMMCVEWNEREPPFTKERMSRILKLTDNATIDRVFEALRPCYEDVGGLLVHPRLAKERRKQLEWREKSSQGGRRSASLRASKGGSSLVQPTSNQSPTLQSASALSDLDPLRQHSAQEMTKGALVLTSESASSERPTLRAAKRVKHWIAFAGERLEVSKDDLEDMVRQMGTNAFDLTEWFLSLDKELVASGDPWDRAWLWSQFRSKTRDMFGDTRPATRREIEEARGYIRRIGTGCPHDPKCDTPDECVSNVVWFLRQRKTGRGAA